MSDQQLLAVLTAILLAGSNPTSDDQVRQAVQFAKRILEETK